MSKQLDVRVPDARADRQAHKDESNRLREQVVALKNDLRRARRCLAAARFSADELRARLRAQEQAYAFAVGTLCQIAFPKDRAKEKAARAIRDAHERHARLLADGVSKDAPERVACEAELHALLGTQPVAALTDAQKAVAKAAVDAFFDEE